ncbi:MAG: GNAT family N-acetyltransferase [Hyphomicrobiaceae bacterium]|nr:GNAT family N-acetyltransferase [Hyphomicrobiaceae bacterium]
MSLIRAAVPADLADIAAIYRPEVLGGTATYEVDPPDEAEFARRREAVLAAGLPWLVAEIDGRVAGYAYAGPFRPRVSYRWSVENSVYVASDAKGHGVGRVLLQRLIAEVTARGFRQMVAVIGDNTNVASIRLHASQGFTSVGVHRGIAFKHGRWLDSLHMQRPLGDGSATPPV